MNDSGLIEKNQKSQLPTWHKYSILIVIIFAIFTVIGVLISHFSGTKENVEDNKLENDKKIVLENKKQENNNENQNKKKEENIKDFPVSYQVEQEFYDGKAKFDNAINELKEIDKVQDSQKAIEITDQAIIEFEEVRELMLYVDPNSPVYDQAQVYLKDSEQHSLTANKWKLYFTERALLSNINKQKSSQKLDNSAIVSNKRLPELSLKQKSSFLTAMKPHSVALTFDDGPTREYTPQILEILYKNNIQATFFVVGKRVRENCDILRAIYQSGHEIGNHTDTHPYLTKISQNAQAKEIQNVQESVNQCLGGQYPMNWFRAPYGDQNPDVLNIAHRFGLSSVQWVVDTHDWKKTSSIADIKNTINDYSNPGVILMHDGSLTNPNFIHPNENSSRQNTVNALQSIINSLKNRGFNFVSLSKAFK